jgi:integrase
VPREFDLDWRQVPITLGPDGLYHGKITVGHKANGRLDRRHRTGKTAKEVENKLRELVKEIEAGRKRKPGRTPTVEEWLSTWLTDIAPYGRRALKPRTLADYWSKSRNWIFPHLGAHRLDDLEPEHVDALHAAMRRAKKAESHILKVHAIGRRALAVAMARGKLTRNVFEMVDPPAAAKPKRTPLDTDVARRVIEVAAGRRNGTRWMVGLAIGPRQGEALGLCWPLVDLDAGTVEIAWQLQRLPWRHGCDDPHACGGTRHRFKACRPANRGARKGTCQRHPGVKGCPPPCKRDCTKHAANCPRRTGGGLVLTRPKTWREDADPHVVHLPEQVVQALREHRDRQRAERRRAGTAWRPVRHPEGGEAELVFRQADGAPIDPRQDWQEWQDILAEAGTVPGRVHAGRHTAATMLLELGVDAAIVQEVLGHADPRSTRGYQKVRTGATKTAASRMGEGLFSGASVTDLVTERQKRRTG